MSSASFSPHPLLVFNGENYHIWVVKMKTYLQAFDLWEIVNADIEPPPLRANPTIAQIRQHSDNRAKKYNIMSCLQSGVSDVKLTRIMTYETLKETWDKLKDEFQCLEKTRQQQLINLRRDLENLKIREVETVKHFTNRSMAMVNSIRLLED
ncbi:uncharacterized protein LOC108487894 [Gossypium arboreum]|uniref:DUF4219 domain-containing protein n=1 Tax=Gossypium arboreum TaxID=29729 RepID=A0ABR0NIT4_GOSAR|nr:uncharacterized protein LOC108487894 [Gossypium arboreum]KAK5794785.1 hypothetical protein PVK06_036031 [Gossypium arboreum]